MFWLLFAIAAVVLLALLGGGRFASREDQLPRDFDFDHYKTRELNRRGLFDKTKWR